MSENQYLIVCNRPDHGQIYIGPFPTEDDALHYAERTLQAVEWWWVCILQKDPFVQSA
jgi:hypothetical protein